MLLFLFDVLEAFGAELRAAATSSGMPTPRAFIPPPVLFRLSMTMIPEADVFDLSCSRSSPAAEDS